VLTRYFPNRELGGHDLICKTEGVACEAISYAGHLKLNNLTIIYDNNQITCDGSVDLTNTEDVNKKMEACGWDVIDVLDGVNDVEGIVSALDQGRDPTRTKPLFINIRSIIGVGSALAGQAISHGAPLGKENVAAMKKAYGWDPEKKFHIPDKVKSFYADLPSKGEHHVQKWNDLLTAYAQAHPTLSQTFHARISGALPPTGPPSSPPPSPPPQPPPANPTT
jgi:dihydroxyacetone synthase